MPQILINDIIRQLHEIQDGSRWFDQCFREKTAGLTNEEFFARPLPQLHSVAEHIAHILAWRKECLLRFTGQYTDLMNSPEDWPDNNALQHTGRAALMDQFYESTETLVAALKDRDDSYLDTPFRDTEYNFHYLIEGIIQHDLYHLGQAGVTIKLLKR